MVYHFRIRGSWATAVAVTLAIGVSFTGGAALAETPSAARVQAPLPPESEASRLEATEDLSESLANDILELSVAVRDRDLARTGEFFADTVLGPPFPSVPGEAKPQVKWIALHDWSAGPGADLAPRPTPRADLLAAFGAFLDHFSEIEDVRFKVKGATFDADARSVPGADQPTAVPGAEGSASVAFLVWGRDPDGRREWARGMAEARVGKREAGPWRFTSFKVVKLDSQTADVDLFSEVAVPAGLDATLPPYGEPPNVGFTWHGAAAGDWNQDGWLDLFVTGPERNWLYLNDGHGHFRDASAQTGVLAAASGVGRAGARLRQRRRPRRVPRGGRRAGAARESAGSRRHALASSTSRRRRAWRCRDRVQRGGRRRQRRRPSRDLRRVLQPLRPGHARRLVQGHERHPQPAVRLAAGRHLPRGGEAAGGSTTGAGATPRSSWTWTRTASSTSTSSTTSARRRSTCAAATASWTRRKSAVSSTPATAWASRSATSTTTAGSTST